MYVYVSYNSLLCPSGNAGFREKDETEVLASVSSLFTGEADITRQL